MNVIAVKKRDAQSSEDCTSPPLLQRSVGVAELTFKKRKTHTVLDHLHQQGCCKIRFPKEENLAQAVLINTSGGLTDYDKMDVRVHWRADTTAIVTSQAAEKIYKSRGAPAHIINELRVDQGATAFWAPQETILFEGGQVTRQLTAHIEKGGSLLALESVVFGRTAMGETLEFGALTDKWRLHYDGKLVFADTLSLQGSLQAQLSAPALLGGATACASFVYVGEHADELSDHLAPVLSLASSKIGISVQGPVLVMRLLSEDAQILREDIMIILNSLLAHNARGTDIETTDMLPRVWSC